MGQTIKYLFFALLLSVCVAGLAMFFGPVLYVKATGIRVAGAEDARYAAHLIFIMFLVALAVVQHFIPEVVMRRRWRLLAFVALPIVLTAALPYLGFGFLGVMVALALVAVPAVYQVLVSSDKKHIGQ